LICIIADTANEIKEAFVMRSKRINRIFINIALLVLLAGSLVLTSGEALAGTKTTLTDLTGRKITLDLPVKSMVIPGWSGSGNPFYTLFALMGDDATKMIVGMGDSLKLFRHWVWEKYLERYPALANIPNVGRPPEINVEKIISLKPDVVVVPTGAYISAKDGCAILEKAGIPVVQIDYHAQSMEKHIKSMKLIGDLVGRPERAKELIDFYKAQCDLVYDRLAKSKHATPRVYYETGYSPKEYGSTSGKWMWGVLMQNAGGLNIARDKFERSGKLSPEFVLKADPEVVFFAGANWKARPESLQLGYNANEAEAKKRLSRFLTRPGWEHMTAVKNKKVFGLYMGISREIWDFYALQCLAKWFHPELFKDLNPLDGFKEFHEKFLGVKFSGVWSVELD
jgi:iron complex transport system substrate-binding protein